MKTRSMMFYVVALIIALGMSQSVMAKEKKVKYLGHNYKGEVNDKKVPAGKGMMNVHGLMIEGVFDDHSVSNAIVWRTEYLGASNTTFSGTITYDESENIVLKAGGVISTKYYMIPNKGSSRLVSDHPSFVEDTLKEDRVVNSGNFEPKELTIPSKFQISDNDFKKLNPPVFKTSYTVGLTHVDEYDGKKINMDVFCEYAIDDKKPVILGYKDNEGRIWNYMNGGLSVKYPNGSYLECGSKGISDYLPEPLFWEIHYPNGKNVKTKWSKIGSGLVYDMGRFKIGHECGTRYFQFIEIFAKNVNKEKFIAPRCWDISITSDSIDFERLSNSETEKFIREEIIPYIEDGTSEYVTYTTPNGKFKDGVFTSNKQEAAAKAKRATEKAAVLNKSIASFKKKYGFDPSINNVRSIVKVGRNVLGVINARNEWIDEYAEGADRNETIKVQLVKDQGISKCYEFFSVAGAFYCGYFWTRNNVITSIYWGPKRFR